jgi:hypothetical protein
MNQTFTPLLFDHQLSIRLHNLMYTRHLETSQIDTSNRIEFQALFLTFAQSNHIVGGAAPGGIEPSLGGAAIPAWGFVPSCGTPILSGFVSKTCCDGV